MSLVVYTPRVKWIVSVGWLFVVMLCVSVASARTWPAAVGEGTICLWSDDKVAAYTLTIDDNHAGDIPFWLDLGDQYGFKWTWFLITGNVGSGNGGTWMQWQNVVDQGHCIGSHGLTAYDSSPIDVETEYRDSQQALRDNLSGVDALTLAYPNGYVPPNDAILATQYYISARGVVGGVNIAPVNYMDTKSISMTASSVHLFDDPSAWMYYGHLINPAHQYYGGWYSVHFHYVSGMEANITNMMESLKSSENDIWVGRFQDVAQYAQEFESATLNVTTSTASEIRFILSDSLDNPLFYFPLTVKFRVPSDWSAVSAVQNGASIPIELVTNEGGTYALVKAVPDAGGVTLQKVGGEGLLVIIRGRPRNQIWVDGAFSGPSSDGSYTAPYQTIQAGLDVASPGDTVTVREGTYREQITLPSGTADLPVTLSASPGERVVLNGMVPVTDWLVMTAGLYSKLLDWAPLSLYSGFERMMIAREPNEGWWEAVAVETNESAGTFIIVDADHLTGFSNDLENASATVWAHGVDRTYTCPVISFDSATGRLEIGKANPDMELAAGDKYWLQNQVSLIDQPGEWAHEPAGAAFRLYYYPSNRTDLDDTQIPPASGRVITGQNVAHVRLNGLEVAGGLDRGIYLVDVEDIKIDRCLIHNNYYYGIWLQRAQDCSVENSISMDNRFGIHCDESTNIEIANNEIGWNTEDGLVLANNSSNLWIRSNYIHDHLLWGHPDNSQMYGNVMDVHFIDNLIMTAGQSVMMEEASAGEFSGNMIIGSGANMLNFGHGSASNFIVQGNTFALAGYNCLGMTAQDYEVKENIFVSGHGSPIYTISDIMNYQGNRNLFWNDARLIDPIVLVSAGTWQSGLGDAELFSIVYENNNVSASDTSTAVDSAHADVAAGSLSFPDTFPPSNWPDALTAQPNDATINTLSAAISGGDYFTFTVTPNVDATVSYSNLFVRVSLGANVVPAQTVFSLLSSLSGFTDADTLLTFTNETLAASTMGIENSLDLSGFSELQNIAEGTEIEFRLYAHNGGANAMTRVGIGHAFSDGAVADDLCLEGSVSVGSGGGTPETISHTDLESFQTRTRQEFNSANANPLFVNAPFGINVLDAERLDEATRDTFILRQINHFLVGDHVEINFDGVVRTVTAVDGDSITVDPALSEKPLKSWLIANWGIHASFSLDLGVQFGSPAIGLGESGATAGSSISIRKFQNGDFDGDGLRDLLALPQALER